MFTNTSKEVIATQNRAGVSDNGYDTEYVR